MNKIWMFIIISSITIGIITNHTKEMIESLFLVPSNTLKILLKIGSMLIIYSGLFQIANDANIIKKLSMLIIKPVNKIFKTDDEELKSFICASIICNMLGLGPANMAIAMKVVERISTMDEKKYYNLTLYLLINISSLCFLPLTTLTLRQTYLSNINLSFIVMIFLASFITTIFAIIIVKIWCKDE